MSKPIKDFLYALVPDTMQWKILLLENWGTIIGPMKDRVTIHTITDYSLILEVSHPAWAQELLHLAPLIKDKINSLLQANYIKDIRFKVVAPHQRNKPSTATRNAYSASFLKKRKQSFYTLTVHEEKALASIQDSELQEAMRAFLISSKRM